MNIVVTGGRGDLGQTFREFARQAGHDVWQAGRADCDVTSTASIRSVLGAAWPFQGVVCCHGAKGLIKPTLEVTDEEWEHVIDVDLSGAFRVCREAGRYLLAERSHGSIVIVSSIHALATYPQRAAYAAAKAGVVGLVRALAIEWGGHGVRVNAVLPGQVAETKRTAAVHSQRMIERAPTGSLVDRVEVAAAIMALLTNTGINGTTLVVDDGWLASAYWGPHE